MELIFVRHGETQHNKDHQLMGQRIDDTLDVNGLHQAEEIIAKLPADAALIYSSPLKRATQTAEIISRHLNVRVEQSEYLKERDFGALSGKTWEEIHQETGMDLAPMDQNLQYDYRPYGGESVAQVKSRLLKFLELVKQKHKDGKLIVVAHLGLIMLMDQLYPQKVHHSIGNVSVHKYQV